jgi:hypothetical protein
MRRKCVSQEERWDENIIHDTFRQIRNSFFLQISGRRSAIIWPPVCDGLLFPCRKCFPFLSLMSLSRCQDAAEFLLLKKSRKRSIRYTISLTEEKQAIVIVTHR